MLPPSAGTAAARPQRKRFTPSWVDGLQGLVERLPWPGWASYLGACAALGGQVNVLEWSAGAYPAGAVFPYHLGVFGTGVFGLAPMHYLDRTAQRALTLMRPTLTLWVEELDDVRYGLATMPAGGAAVATRWRRGGDAGGRRFRAVPARRRGLQPRGLQARELRPCSGHGSSRGSAGCRPHPADLTRSPTGLRASEAR